MSTPDPRTSDESESRADRRARYAAALRCIARQFVPAAPGARPAHVRALLADRYDPDRVDATLRAAREQGAVVRYRDPDGRWRLVRTVAVEPPPDRHPETDLIAALERVHAPAHPDPRACERLDRALVRVLERLAGQDDPPAERIGRINAARQEVGDGE